MKTPWEQAADFSDPIWASVAEDMLTRAGFVVMLQTTGPGSVYPGASTVWRLLVAEGRAPEAREYLKNHLEPGDSGAPGPGNESGATEDHAPVPGNESEATEDHAPHPGSESDDPEDDSPREV